MAKQQDEFGFVSSLPDEVEMIEIEARVRGQYDVSRIESSNPRLVGVVTYLLSVPGMTHKKIAEICSVSWETVAAIAGVKQESVREFKLKLAGQLGLCLEAAGPQLLARIQAGKVTALDYKLLAETYMMLQGQATQVIEVRREDPAFAKFDELMAELAKGRAGAENPQSGGLASVAGAGATGGEPVVLGLADGGLKAPVPSQVIDVEMEEI